MLDDLTAGDGRQRLLTYLAEIFDSGLLNLVESSLLSAQPVGAALESLDDDGVLVS
jgi:hypothetical protein